MSIQDPISDLLIQIKNGYLSKKKSIIVFSSKFKIALIDILKKEFFIDRYVVIKKDIKKPKVEIFLKYYGFKKPILRNVKRISKASLRIYSKKKYLFKYLNGFNTIIISTSAGLMTDKEAIKLGYGGEVLCVIE